MQVESTQFGERPRMIDLYLAFVDDKDKDTIILYDHKYDSKVHYNGEIRSFKDLYLALLSNPDLTFTGRRTTDEGTSRSHS